MKQIITILLAVLFISCSATGQIADPDTSVVQTAPVAELADTTDKPVQFNEFLGTRIDSAWVLLEFAAIRKPTPENEITRYMTHKEVWLVVKTDVWRGSRGTPREDYFELLGGAWVKVSPANIIRVTPLQR